MIRCQIVQFVLIISFSTIYTLNQDNCPRFVGDENVVTLTYEKFRDSTDKVVRISDEVEQPISLSSFFITRNKIKQQIYQYNCAFMFQYWEECVQKNIECELDATSHENCILKDIARAPVLIYLDISNGHLQNLHSNTFATASECLQCLVLNSNEITKIPKEIFASLNNLEYLYLSHNKITELNISPLTQLKYLNLSNNNIKFINSTTFTTSLIELDLSNNTIILQSNMFEYLSNLIQLFLNNNAINDVPVNTFYGLINLKTLSLANNNLKSFEFGSFSGLINLETLDLSNNQLNYFDSNKFMNLNNLQILLIDGNPFNNLNLTDLNVKLINLRTIGLTNMFWTCEKLVKVIIELRKMNVSLKNNSLSNQLNYNIDGINCIPDGYETANYLKKIFIQSTTIQPVENNKSLKIENVQSVRNSTDLANTKHLEHNKSVILPDIDNSLNQFQNNIEYNNVSMPPLFLIFLQKIENIIKNETGYIKNSLKNLESTTSLLLHKFEEIEELHHIKHDFKADTLIEAPTFTTEYYDSDFSLMYNDEN